jgi:hypothetical protein
VALGTSEAATQAALTRQGLILGATASMSPEQIEGKPVDEHSDLFATLLQEELVQPQ